MDGAVPAGRPLLLRGFAWMALALCLGGWIMSACLLLNVGGNLPAQIVLEAEVVAFVLGLASLEGRGALAAGLAALTLLGWLTWGCTLGTAG